ncbi:site-2 protease family protein [Flammeovirgaceae bacterium SG7u.111]|nr:site-2 protease family protein [Flammeovirgaceae bacterium SG7u.132]WPO34720.1 site-2 protease family protein [Flammeovirgaceae bacterium SG7u.111]
MFGNIFFFSNAPLDYDNFLAGFYFSIPFLSILTAHEFGHYFTAKYYKLKVTLPYYIPMWFLGFGPSIGTMGAFIQIKSPLHTRKQFFDVGIAGPLAGFILAIGVIFYGFTHLPSPEQIFEIHPEYAQYGLDYADYVYEDMPEGSIVMGTNLLFEFFKEFVVEDPSLIPNEYEIMHSPLLLAGFLACFFTALNLIPIGQLDGGHILYGLIGPRLHRWVSPALFILFIFFGGLGLFSAQDFHVDWSHNLEMTLIYLVYLYFTFSKITKDPKSIALIAVSVYTAQFLFKSMVPTVEGYTGWLVFGFLIGRFLGVYHPPAIYEQPIGWKRKVIGWLSLIIFVISFSPTPFIIK